MHKIYSILKFQVNLVPRIRNKFFSKERMPALDTQRETVSSMIKQAEKWPIFHVRRHFWIDYEINCELKISKNGEHGDFL